MLIAHNKFINWPTAPCNSGGNLITSKIFLPKILDKNDHDKDFYIVITEGILNRNIRILHGPGRSKGGFNVICR